MKLKVKQWIKKNIKWIIALICLLGFLALAEDVFHQEEMAGDSIGYHFIATYLISDKITPAIQFITNFGGAICCLSITILLLLFAKNKRIGIAVGVNLIIATAFNILLKSIFQRPRPIEYRIIDESGYSFPSGHSMVSMAFYGFLIYLIYKYVKNKYVKWGSISMVTLLILTIGISRIYLGVHYASDVLAGFLFSISYLIVFIHIICKYWLAKKNS